MVEYSAHNGLVAGSNLAEPTVRILHYSQRETKMSKNSMNEHQHQPSRKESRKTRQLEGDQRNKEWRSLTFKKQMEQLMSLNCWITTKENRMLTKQAKRITSLAEKHGWDARPIDVLDYTPAKKKEKKAKKDLVFLLPQDIVENETIQEEQES